MTVAQTTRSRIALAVLAVFIPTSGLACFDGDWYAINLQDGIAYLAIAGVALVCAAVVQMLSNRFVWYAPILVAAVAYALPIIELLRWGNGDCGVVFLSRSQLSVAVAGAFLAYESFRSQQPDV